MDSELDANKIIAEFMLLNVERAAEALGGKVRGASNAVGVRFKKNYSNYLNRVFARHSRGKSFFVRGESAPLYSVFVPLDLLRNKSDDGDFLYRPGSEEVAAVDSHAIVIGTGGSGKSMLMRHLVVDTVIAAQKTPIFVELRDLNGYTQPLLQKLLDILNTNGLKVDEDFLIRALDAGHFSIFLDGFDELDQASRQHIANEIRWLAQRFSGNRIILSSRPDAALSQWDEFTEFFVAPLDLERASELVRKLPFDDPIKGKFDEDLKSGLFESHESFLSIPLLLSIMLLTYADVAHIPSKLSIFYNQAYESLFQKHDALKGGFQRERRSKLDIQDFARVFAAFSLHSYDKRSTTFSTTTALDFLDKAKSLCSISYSSSDVLVDSIQAVCLLLEEGQSISFSHRSFQEYFVALFIGSLSNDAQKGALIRLYSDRVESDAVLHLLYEIDPEAVERHYFLPSMARLKEQIGYSDSLTPDSYWRLFQLMFTTFNVDDDGMSLTVRRSADKGDVSQFVRFFHTECATHLYQPPLDEVDWLELQSLVERELAEHGLESYPLRVDHLLSDSEIARAMWNSTSFWGAPLMKSLFTAEQEILDRHKRATESLDSILSQNA